MKVIGIEIKGREVRIIALEKHDGVITDITGSYKPLKFRHPIPYYDNQRHNG